MRYPILIALLSVSLAAQNPPANCKNPITRDVDARCSCLKDPDGTACALAKRGFYDGPVKITPPTSTSGINFTPAAGTAAGTQPARPQPAPPQAQPKAARVVPLAHTDYLRFLDPSAHLAAGFDFAAASRSPELMGDLFGKTDSQDARNRVLGALQEMDRLWLSSAGPNDAVVLMTGKFEAGVTAGIFYAQGVQPVFLGGAHAMMVGPEPSIQAALARLAKPAATDGGWVARRARELSQHHETWIVKDVPGANSVPTALGATPMAAIRQFALGVRLTGEVGLDGEAIADSDASAEKIAAWIDQMKAALRGKTGSGPLDSLTVERAGSSLRFAANDDTLLAGEPGTAAMNSDFGVALYSVLAAGVPGMPSSTVAAGKLQSVKAGMKREEVQALLGKPLSVASIQGLDPPRETWTYQVPFGKQFSMRLDGGVVTVAPR
jgi:hypothetical protein